VGIVDSRPLTSKTKFWRVTSGTRINTHLQKCSEQGTPERLPCSRLITWFRSKTKEICNKVCRWLIPSSTPFRAANRESFKLFENIRSRYSDLKNKVIKRFHKTSLIRFRAVGNAYPDFAFPPFYDVIDLFPNFLREDVAISATSDKPFRTERSYMNNIGNVQQKCTYG
jgi:hypothetical protein